MGYLLLCWPLLLAGARGTSDPDESLGYLLAVLLCGVMTLATVFVLVSRWERLAGELAAYGHRVRWVGWRIVSPLLLATACAFTAFFCADLAEAQDEMENVLIGWPPLAGLLGLVCVALVVAVWRAAKRPRLPVTARPSWVTVLVALVLYYGVWYWESWFVASGSSSHASIVAWAYVGGQLLSALWRRRFLLAGDLIAVPVTLCAFAVSSLVHADTGEFLWQADTAWRSLLLALTGFLFPLLVGHAVVLAVMGLPAAARRLLPSLRDRLRWQLPARVELAWCVAPAGGPTPARFQFGLRTLLIATLLLGFVSGWAGIYFQRQRRQQQAIEAIVALGGQVELAKEPTDRLSGLKWLRDLVGEGLFASVREVRFPPTAGDSEIEHVRDVYTLEDLSLRYRQVTDAGLASVARLSRLKRLDLSCTAVGDEGIAHLRNLDRLQALGLCCTEVGDQGLAQLEGLSRLTNLDLDFTPVTDAAAETLQRLPELKQLSLNDTLITPAAAKKLRQTRDWDDFQHLTAPSPEHRRAMAVIGRRFGEVLVFHDSPGGRPPPGRQVLVYTASADEVDAIIEQLAKVRGVVSLSLFYLGAPDRVGALVATMPEVRFLQWRDPAVTNAHLQPLARLTDLTSIDLVRTSVSDAGLVYLEGMNQLQDVSLDGTGVAGPGLAHLAGATGLESLSLDATPLVDAGLEHIARHTKLRDLRLSGTQITDAGLAHLETLTELGYLDLESAQVGDAGLAHLKSLRNLKTLYLCSTRVTDAGLAHLEGLSALEIVDLEGTKVTAAGVDRLQRALPEALIVWSPPPQPIEGDDWDQQPPDADEAAETPREEAEKVDLER